MTNNIVCEKLGIKYPIIQGPMAFISSDERLVTAVSNAGGLGVLAVAFGPVERAIQIIRKTKAGTDKPFGVAIMPFIPTTPQLLDAIIGEKVPVAYISTHPRLFDNVPGFVERLKGAGVTVMAKACAVSEAITFDKLGIDFIVAKGYDGGGHVYSLTGSLVLIPQVVDAVSTPVIGASGIGDGRGIAAALMLGAKGAEIGSRFILANESPAHENFKKAIIEAKETDTVITGLCTGEACRQLKNKLSERLLKMEKELPEEEAIKEIMTISMGSLFKGAVEGEIQDQGAVLVGQVSGLLNKRQSVQEIMDELVSEYTELLRNAPKLLE
jgi:enoyl-[acyl-carrier protein] reductase II